MPHRPRSHQVEDISVRRFEDALPPAWVSRLVVPDYGVDREVELFSEAGEATGLKFAVQLKATDNAKRADRVSLKVVLLDYLREYEIPAMVVRYDAPANRLRWQWATLIDARTTLKEGQKSFTYVFGESELWDDETPRRIEQILAARRALTNFPQGSALPVRLTIDDALAGSAYAIKRVMRGIFDRTAGSLAEASDRAPLELNIRVRSGFLSIDFDMLGSITFDVDTTDSTKLEAAILYGMAFLFDKKRLHSHARVAARAILAGGHVAGDARLAARTLDALAGDGVAQADLAILNQLHLQDTVYYALIMAKLVKAGQREESTAPSERFLSAALAAVADDPFRAASVHYSLANALRPSRRAIRHYNRARHLRASYMHADYFLGELGSAFFSARRYACAAEAYRRAIAVNATHRLHLCHGDALLHCGDAEGARLSFKLAAESDAAPLAEESIVKLELAEMLKASHGPRLPADWSRPMGDIDQGTEGYPIWAGHLANVNALDPLAHFNLGVRDAGLGDFVSALGHFVACAVVQPLDVEAWTNAVISAFRTGQAELAVTLVHVSIGAAGLDAYDALRANLLSQGGDPELIAELDKAAVAAAGREDPTIPGGVTLRILDGDRAVVIGQTEP